MQLIVPPHLPNAMVSKTHKHTANHKAGFSLLELIISIGILTLLIGMVIVLINPAEYRAKARDERRLADLTTLERLILEYRLDKGTYPDLPNLQRISTVLPPTNRGPLRSNTSGWIAGDFSVYYPMLPTDPLNDDQYFYTYTHTGNSYEITARLEHFTEMMENDGGNDPEIYEVGNNLLIM